MKKFALTALITLLTMPAAAQFEGRPLPVDEYGIQRSQEQREKIREQRPGIEFHLYGQRQPDNFLNDLLNKEGITHHGIIMPLEKKFEIMGKAHCFIIPSSFNPKSHHFYRYSFPTKLPELILSGRPIVSYGPSDTATNRILKSHKIGIRIHSRSVNALIIACSVSGLQQVDGLPTKYAHVPPSDAGYACGLSIPGNCKTFELKGPLVSAPYSLGFINNGFAHNSVGVDCDNTDIIAVVAIAIIKLL